MKKIFVVMLVCCLLLVGCSTVHVTQLNSPNADVQLYGIEVYWDNRPEDDYIELAHLYSTQSDEENCLHDIIDEAKRMNADGIIILGNNSKQTSFLFFGTGGFLASEPYGLEVIAFKYR